MTRQEKIIVSAYTGTLMCDFVDVHEYIEKKLGRPVYTHELADKNIWEEIKEKSKEDFLELCKREDPERKEDRWIPTSEKLPDELAEVNVTWENTEPEPYCDFVKGHCFTGTAVYFRGRWYWYSAVCVDYLREYGFSPNDEMDDAIKVLAWMPLPEPYKERREE